MSKAQFTFTQVPSTELGCGWVEIYTTPVKFMAKHFETALYNLILQPEINSTVLLRADILKNVIYKYDNDDFSIGERIELPCNPDVNFQVSLLNDDINNTNKDNVILQRNLNDLSLHSIPSKVKFHPKQEMIRRLVPRNPFKDYIINQTCLVLTKDETKDDESILIVYIPHIATAEECPYYLPPVQAVGIYYNRNSKILSLNYLPFNYNKAPLEISQEFIQDHDENHKTIRIAFRLLQTAKKHSTGIMDGYEKRVQHDVVISKVLFQNRYIALKKKYSQFLINNWQENTDPKKHVFEDIAIAAFLIELWIKIYQNEKSSFQFADLGCGNGVLVYILIMEGYKGIGIDARSRKSWKIFESSIGTDVLKEQVIIPKLLLDKDPKKEFKVELKNSNFKTDNHGNHNLHNKLNNNKEESVFETLTYTAEQLMDSSYVNTADFEPNTFLIGNHSDELTLWIPLFNQDFVVIPCCSHDLSGKKTRFSITSNSENNNKSNSAYSGLVQHTEEVSKKAGWDIEREMLRIPSTRNCAIVGYRHFPSGDFSSVEEIIKEEGGAEGWVESCISLMKSAPRGH